MKSKYLFFFTLALLCFKNNTRAQVISYPETRKDSVIETYYDTEVQDPYRWLEDDNSTETIEWVKQQNQITEGYLKEIPFRAKLKERLLKIWNFPKYTVPQKEQEFYFYQKNDGIQNQSIVYMQKGIDGKAVPIIDPNKFSLDGTIALTSFSVSGDAKYIAYATSKAGSDWEEISVFDLETKKPLTDQLKWVKFSNISWKADGFYYSRYNEPGKDEEKSKQNEFHKVFFHKVGTPQTEDVLVFQDTENPLRTFSAETTDDERYLIIYESETTSGNQMYVKDLNMKRDESKKEEEFKKIASGFDFDFRVIDNIGSSLMVITNKKAPKYRLISISMLKPDEEKWKNIIPEKEDVLQDALICGEKLIAKYMKDASSRIYVHSLTGEKEDEIILPDIGTVDDISGSKEDNHFLYSFTSFTTPATIYKYEVAKKNQGVLFPVKLGYKPDMFETEQVFFDSKDGTKIPMFIVKKKGMELDGSSPCLLFGYGGFNISKTPEYRPERISFLESGGIFAMPNLRGGGEYGEEWHKAGIKLNKQNVFDDFIAAAEYLIANNYTTSSSLAISGRSNGGLLVGAVMTQKPELFKVAIPIVGVMDMLRFHKFTIGWSWVGDYGSSDNEEDFRNLYKYSPLHRIQEATAYPNTLVVTGDHDDRVVPGHSFKFLATLQEKYKGDNVALIRVDTQAGHGAGKPISKIIDEQTDIMTFIMYNLGMEPKIK